jgi:hypothetical protein
MRLFMKKRPDPITVVGEYAKANGNYEDMMNNLVDSFFTDKKGIRSLSFAELSNVFTVFVHMYIELCEDTYQTQVIVKEIKEDNARTAHTDSDNFRKLAKMTEDIAESTRLSCEKTIGELYAAITKEEANLEDMYSKVFMYNKDFKDPITLEPLYRGIFKKLNITPEDVLDVVLSDDMKILTKHKVKFTEREDIDNAVSANVMPRFNDSFYELVKFFDDFADRVLNLHKEENMLRMTDNIVRTYGADFPDEAAEAYYKNYRAEYKKNFMEFSKRYGLNLYLAEHMFDEQPDLQEMAKADGIKNYGEY